MSFRNTDFINNDSNSAQPRKKITQNLCGAQRVAQQSPLERTVGKIASAIVDLHDGYLSKCANLEIFRDLSNQQQELLEEIENNNQLHTALTGILAIDSCVKTLQKQEERVMQDISSSLTEVLQNFKDLQSEICKFDQHFDLSSYCQRLSESLKQLIQQIYTLPSAKCRQHQSQKLLIILQHSQLKHELGDKVNKQTDGQKQRLRRMVQQKQAQINRLQAKQRIPRLERLQDRKTFNIGFRTSRQRSTTQNDSNSPGQFKKTYGQIIMLKDQLKEKNIIIERMNDEFASEMEKYNSVFKRIEQQNRLLKKYVDIDTAYLLEQLQMEIQAFRQEKRKDQFIINDIQRKIQGISMSRTSRVNTRTPFDYQREIPVEYSTQQYPSYEPFSYREGPQNKFYSPNLAPSRHSPYNRQIAREQVPFQSYPFKQRPRPVLPSGKKLIQGEFTRKSRSKQILTARQGRQNGEAELGPPNLFERVMLRR